MRRQLSVVLVVAIGACLVGWTANSRMEERETWEYQEVQLSRTEVSTPTLNRLGAAGWELTSVISACQTDQYCQYYAYFKRAK